jgi:hypothetical protein
MLTSLMDLGCQDRRLDIAYDWAARRVTGDVLPRKINHDGLSPSEGVSGPFHYVKFLTDPLFGCRTNKSLACAWAATLIMMAFSRLPAARRTDLIKRAINDGLDFFFSGDLSKAEFPGHRAGTPDPRWWQFAFPAFGNDILRIAEALTGLGYGNDPRLSNTLDFIRKKQDENGRWPLEVTFPNNKTWIRYGLISKPNKWVTLRALRVLKQAVK